MDEILDELNLSPLKKNFQDNKVGPTEVLSLTEEDFRSLGVDTIGERALLRQRCKDLVSESVSESPVVQRLRMFQSRRRQRVGWRGQNSTASRSTTRRLHIGWKHKFRSTYTLISAGKGGGSQTFDAEKHLTLTDLENKVIGIYFPGGVNETQNLDISRLQYHLAHFNGKKLPNHFANEDFTVELLYTHRKSYPIRIYLHTSAVEEQPAHEAPEEEPDAIQGDNTSVVMDMEESRSDDGDELPSLDSGTPTIVFNVREHTESENSQDEITITDEDLEQPTETEGSDESVQRILLRLNAYTNVGRHNLVNVTRDNVLPGALRAFKRASFTATNQLSVKFAGEFAIDEGGPSREFFRLLLKELSSMPIFIGPDECKLLDINYPALQSKTYQTVGMMLAYSLVHGGPPPSFLSPLLYDVIVGGIDSVTPTLDHVFNPEYKEQITMLSQAEDPSTVPEAVELIFLAGCGAMMHRADRKEEMIAALIHFLVLGRVSHCIDQFCHGLETLGVLKAMRQNRHSMKELFVYEEHSIDASTFEVIYTPVFSEEGSNRHRQEKVVHSNWRDVLLDVEEGEQDVSLKDVLIFSTGADRVPPLGLRPQPTLAFHQCDPLSAESKQNFPFANTCSNTLSLPLIEDYDMFKRNMVAALKVHLFTTE